MSVNLPFDYSPTTGLWYPRYLGPDGEIVHDYDSGVTTPPAYIAEADEPLISQDAYLCYTRLSALGIDSAVWSSFACIVSDQIEEYCHYYWREEAEEVPVSVQLVCALATRDLATSSGAAGVGVFKSYSAGGDYSWTLQDGVKAGDCLAPYKSLLSPYMTVIVGM